MVDYALLGLAFGAGFQLVEDLIRRVANEPGLFASLFPLAFTQFDPVSRPGWSWTTRWVRP